MQKGYQGEPKFITERRNRLLRHQLEERSQYDKEIDEALALAKHKPVEIKKGFRYYLEKVTDILIGGRGQEMTFAEVIKEFKEDCNFDERKVS